MITKRFALETCRDLWKWLAEHPDLPKQDWPSWAIVGKMYNDCPCCEYSLTQHRPDTVDFCLDCPLAGRWVEGNVEGTCISSYASYEMWRRSGHAPQYATAIASACITALAELDEQEKAQNAQNAQNV
jgi:hypothetical protein